MAGEKPTCERQRSDDFRQEVEDRRVKMKSRIARGIFDFCVLTCDSPGPRSVPALLDRSFRFCSPVLLFVLCLFLLPGCGQPQAPVPAPAKSNAAKTAQAGGRGAGERVGRDLSSAASTLVGFAPVKISVLPLSEFSGASGTGLSTVLNGYVALLDAFGSPLKTPGTLRFELYEYVPRSAEPKGQRVAIWPDLDLTDPAENNKYWRDFLRAYEFELDVRADRNKTYILEVTYLCPDNRRLSVAHMLRGASPTSDK
jgi:hypothetical protein